MNYFHWFYYDDLSSFIVLNSLDQYKDDKKTKYVAIFVREG